VASLVVMEFGKRQDTSHDRQNRDFSPHHTGDRTHFNQSDSSTGTNVRWLIASRLFTFDTCVVQSVLFVMDTSKFNQCCSEWTMQLEHGVCIAGANRNPTFDLLWGSW